MFRRRLELCRYTKNTLLPLVTNDRRLSGNSGCAGVICNVNALKHSILKPQLQLKERELRRGIERWENEGGRLFPRVIGDSMKDKALEKFKPLRNEKRGVRVS